MADLVRRIETVARVGWGSLVVSGLLLGLLAMLLLQCLGGGILACV